MLTCTVTNGKKPAHIPTSVFESVHTKMAWLRGFLQEGRCKQISHYNLRHRSRTLQELNSGQNVWITTEKAPGTVLGAANMPRSYLVDTDKDVLRKNRIHLRAIEDSSVVTTKSGSFQGSWEIWLTKKKKSKECGCFRLLHFLICKEKSFREMCCDKKHDNV